MLFWIICLLMTAVTAYVVVTPLLRSQDAASDNPDIDFYKAQLAELERDNHTGLIDSKDADAARVEVSRRLLAAVSEKRGSTTSSRMPVVAGCIAAALLAVSFATYVTLGAPGYGDFPLAQRLEAAKLARETRPSQTALEANTLPAPTPDVSDEYRRTVDQLRQIVPGRPDDREGWRLLAQHEGQMRNYSAAAAAQAHLIGLLGDQTKLDQRVYLTDMLVAAAGGFVSPQAEEVVDQILAQDPQNHAALYYKGALYYQTDRADVAFRLWRPVVTDGDPDTYHVAAARAQIEDAAFLAGDTRYALPPLNGPTAQDIENASDMTEADRAAMIAGMVQQLSDRLATDGGTADDWARLIAAHGVLGNTAQAQAVYAEALEVFGSSQAALETLRLAAENAGLTP